MVISEFFWILKKRLDQKYPRNAIFKGSYNHSGVRITKTSHLAERMIASDTEPIKKRSIAFNPVAPQIIKSALTKLANSPVMIFLAEPYSITTFTFSRPSASACALYPFKSSSYRCCARSTMERS
jgi:hypothetical protein